MPAPPHYRISYSGVFGPLASPVEEWSFGLSAAPQGGTFLTQPEMAATAAALAPTWESIKGGIHTLAILTRIRVAYVDNLGKTPRDVTGAYAQGDHPVTLQGNVTGLTRPLQVSLAVSLRTQASGPTGRGRFYLPVPVGGLNPLNGLLDSAEQQGHLSRAVAFMTAIEGVLTPRGIGALVVASGGSVTKAIAPALRPIVQVAVGRRFDIQRRRGNDQEEEYVFAPQ